MIEFVFEISSAGRKVEFCATKRTSKCIGRIWTKFQTGKLGNNSFCFSMSLSVEHASLPIMHSDMLNGNICFL